MEYTVIGNMWWALTCNVLVCIAAMGFMLLCTDARNKQ